jgi:hypothetical protein
MYTWSVNPRGIMEIAGIWKQSTEENVRLNGDGRTMERTKITQKLKEHIQHVILLQRKIQMDWKCTQILVGKPYKCF